MESSWHLCVRHFWKILWCSMYTFLKYTYDKWDNDDFRKYIQIMNVLYTIDGSGQSLLNKRLIYKWVDSHGQVRVLEDMQQLCDQGSVWQTTSLQAMWEISRSDWKFLSWFGELTLSPPLETWTDDLWLCDMCKQIFTRRFPRIGVLPDHPC